MDGFIVLRRDGTAYCVAVSPEDFERVDAAGPWSVLKEGQTFYCKRNLRKRDGRYSSQPLHRFILRLEIGGPEVDHIDGCGLNNQRVNLRLVTRAQQLQNMVRPKGTSRYRGVSWLSRERKWTAQVMKDGKHYSMGNFDDEAQAARAAAFGRAQLFTHSNESRHPFLSDVPLKPDPDIMGRR